jgi:hypothetical protein
VVAVALEPAPLMVNVGCEAPGAPPQVFNTAVIVPAPVRLAVAVAFTIERKFGSYDPPLRYVTEAIRELRRMVDIGQREMFE